MCERQYALLNLFLCIDTLCDGFALIIKGLIDMTYGKFESVLVQILPFQSVYMLRNQSSELATPADTHTENRSETQNLLSNLFHYFIIYF